MKILLLTRYERLGSSSRMRFYQYLPYLESHGLEITSFPFFPDEYVRRLYAGRRQPIRLLAGAYLRRTAALRKARRFDLVWLEKEFLPWLPALPFSAVPYAVDYDDATFHRYDRHHSALVRRFLGKKIDAVMRRARLVVAGNAYLSDRARQAGARQVEILPTVVDMERYPPFQPHGEPTFRIGWIGAPVTAGYLRLVQDALKQFLRNHPEAQLTLIGAQSPLNLDARVETRPWHEASEAAELARFDLGIMPLPDEPFERGKCGYKLIQYMASGLPVVASPVGVNAEIVEDGINGFLVENQGSWLKALETLCADAGLRRRMGAAGRTRVEKGYSLEIAAPRLLELLTKAAA